MIVRNGFTLIELVVALAIIGILAAIGVPSYKSAIERSAIQAQTNATLSLLQLARSEAVTRRQAITVCPSTDLATCNGSNLATGAVVLQGATVIKVMPASQANITAAGSSSLTFAVDGTSTGGTWKTCYTGSSATPRLVTVSLTGRTTTGATTCP